MESASHSGKAITTVLAPLLCSTVKREPKTSHTSGSHLPFWEAGSGHYGDTLGQKNRQTASACIDLVLSWIDTVPVNPKGVFTIGDYGTNDGYSSMPLMESVISHLRNNYGEELAIQIIYEDQEKNDFNSLFNRLSDSTNYMSKFRNVYPLATNVNFYKQCVPDGTCDIIFTSIANHWLEASECYQDKNHEDPDRCPKPAHNPTRWRGLNDPIMLANVLLVVRELNSPTRYPETKSDMHFKDCVFDNFATEEERAPWNLMAARDWSKFLVLRAKELKSEGLLVTVNVASKSGPEPHKPDTLIDVLTDLETAWKQLKEDMFITQEEYDRCICKQRYRTAQEHKSLLETERSAVRQAGLSLVYYDEVNFPCVFKASLQDDQKKVRDTPANRALFADSVVPAHRVWSQATFQSALSVVRTEPEKAVILHELYKRFHAQVLKKDLKSYRSEELIARLVARKT